MKENYKFKNFITVKGENSPQKVVAALKKISDKNDGYLEREHVVKEAENPASTLHSYFEWDDKKAGHKFRLAQATMLICSISIEPTKENEPEQRAFTSIKKLGEGKASFIPTSIALKETFFRNQIIQRAIDELDAAKRKYGNLSQLEDVFDTYDEVKKRLIAEEKNETKMLTVKVTKNKK